MKLQQCKHGHATPAVGDTLYLVLVVDALGPAFKGPFRRRPRKFFLTFYKCTCIHTSYNAYTYRNYNTIIFLGAHRGGDT